jgi:hypothetical protein
MPDRATRQQFGDAMKKLMKEILECDAKRDIGVKIPQAKARFKPEISTARSDRELVDIVRARAKERRIKVKLDQL